MSVDNCSQNITDFRWRPKRFKRPNVDERMLNVWTPETFRAFKRLRNSAISRTIDSSMDHRQVLC